MSRARSRAAVLAGLAGLALGLTACEDPPQDSVQRGHRGVGMVQHFSPEKIHELLAANQVPTASEQLPATGPKARDIYQNVQVLGDLSEGQFGRLMSAMTQWVAPEAGCGYCHNLEKGFANDDEYTKVVSRQMLLMTQDLNETWDSHTGRAGVTCYTCHRGNNVPEDIWFEQPESPYADRMAGNPAGQNTPSDRVGTSSLPNDIFERFLLDEHPIRVQTLSALPGGNRMSTKSAEDTYGLMMHMSESLGVNCAYCHNSRAFYNWKQSTPQRITAWHGIRMVRDANTKHITPLADVFPAKRKGPLGDVGKVNCTTCHQGVYKPLFGAEMITDYPSLDPKADLKASAEATEPDE